MSSPVVEPWGRDVVVELSAGVPYRMYAPRVRRIPSLLEHADRWAGRAHVVQGDRRLDFGELGDLVRRKAAQLREHGVGPGDRVARGRPPLGAARPAGRAR